jgi:hypothetical protein
VTQAALRHTTGGLTASVKHDRLRAFLLMSNPVSSRVAVSKSPGAGKFDNPGARRPPPSCPAAGADRSRQPDLGPDLLLGLGGCDRRAGAGCGAVDDPRLDRDLQVHFTVPARSRLLRLLSLPARPRDAASRMCTGEIGPTRSEVRSSGRVPPRRCRTTDRRRRGPVRRLNRGFAVLVGIRGGGDGRFAGRRPRRAEMHRRVRWQTCPTNGTPTRNFDHRLKISGDVEPGRFPFRATGAP